MEHNYKLDAFRVRDRIIVARQLITAAVRILFHGNVTLRIMSTHDCDNAMDA